MHDDEVVYNLNEINNDASDTVTLGDMVSEEMSDLRSQLAEAEREQQRRADD
jgi:hypothetical protein